MKYIFHEKLKIKFILKAYGQILSQKKIEQVEK